MNAVNPPGNTCVFSVITDDTTITGVDRDQQSTLETEMISAYGARTREGLRTRRVRHTVPAKFRDTAVGQLNVMNTKNHKPMDLHHYAQIYVMIHCHYGICDQDNLMTNDIVTTILTQYHVSKGLKIFGQAGAEAVLKELKQLHERLVIEPMNEKHMTRAQKQAALNYLMFLKKKRSGQIKGRGCADGRKQRAYITKEESSSPTVATEALFLTCVIDAMEKRDVVTVDVPAAFMQADMEGPDVHMKLEGNMVRILEKIDPKLYSKYVVIENGKSVIYVKLNKALYGTIQASLLFWKNLTKTLIEWGFEINPYDWCVANKQENGKQITIVWHVDDLKISHVDPEVNTKYVKALEEQYGKEAPLTITRGKIHDYLGMKLDYSTPGKVVIDMKKYLQEIIDECPECSGHAATPAANHLFEVNSESTKLNLGEAVRFHHIVAKLLFLSKRGRPDTQTTVAFLSTRVKEPDQDDQKKLHRLICYLRDTKDLVLTLEAGSDGTIRWWVDAAFAVHHNMRSHTGGVMTLGKGAIISHSTKQKLNTRSSTEAELVGIDDMMPMVLWVRYFLIAQGFSVSDNVLYQDNQSTMKLAENGKRSSGKRTRHLNIRYFFVTDRIENKEMRVEYCPMDLMWADFYTKPLQGKKFRLFRSMLLNLDDPLLTAGGVDKQVKSDVVVNMNTATSQECVGATRVACAGVTRDACVSHELCTCNVQTRDIVGIQNPSILERLKVLAAVHTAAS